jgi:tetratricopeptide (TPR) repeat protein
MFLVFKRLFLLVMAVLTVLAVFSLSACSKEKQDRPSGDATLSPRFASEAQMLETALKDDPKNLNALTQLGNLYYDWGQNEVDTKGDTAQPEDKWLRAIKYYGQALEIDLNAKFAWIWRTSYVSWAVLTSPSRITAQL